MVREFDETLSEMGRRAIVDEHLRKIEDRSVEMAQRLEIAFQQAVRAPGDAIDHKLAAKIESAQDRLKRLWLLSDLAVARIGALDHAFRNLSNQNLSTFQRVDALVHGVLSTARLIPGPIGGVSEVLNTAVDLLDPFLKDLFTAEKQVDLLAVRMKDLHIAQQNVVAGITNTQRLFDAAILGLTGRPRTGLSTPEDLAADTQASAERDIDNAENRLKAFQAVRPDIERSESVTIGKLGPDLLPVLRTVLPPEVKQKLDYEEAQLLKAVQEAKDTADRVRERLRKAAIPGWREPHANFTEPDTGAPDPLAGMSWAEQQFVRQEAKVRLGLIEPGNPRYVGGGLAGFKAKIPLESAPAPAFRPETFGIELLNARIQEAILLRDDPKEKAAVQREDAAKVQRNKIEEAIQAVTELLRKQRENKATFSE